MKLELPKTLTTIDGIFYVLFPSLCAACDRALPDRRKFFCMQCLSQLNASPMCFQSENLFTERMFGKVALHSGAALYHFSKGGPVQKIVHKLKYQNRPDLGVRAGNEMGKMLLQSPLYQGIDLIIPVPLHPKKEKQRGYNQSAAFAQGISEETFIPMSSQVLVRQTHRASQTQLSRLERYANVHEVYHVRLSDKIAGKHLLLVDDVLTTGATLGTCADLLIKAGAAKVSAVSLAIAL